MRFLGHLLCLSSITISNALSFPSNSTNVLKADNDFSNKLDIAFGATKNHNILDALRTNSTSYLKDSKIHVDCFKQPPRPAYPHRGIVIPRDFCNALQQIIMRPNFLDVDVWDLDPDPDTWKAWVSNDSGIFLGGHVSTFEAFAPAWVAYVAVYVAAQCVDIDKGYLGGIARAGDEGKVLVAVGAKDHIPPGLAAVAES